MINTFFGKSKPVTAIDANLKSNSRGSRVLDSMINILLILTLLVAILCCQFPIFSNHLYVKSDTYNFGVVKAGNIVEHKFALYNLHPWPVTITEAESSCGCTRAFIGQAMPFRLAPMHTVYLDVQVNTEGKIGSVKQTVMVYANDNKNGIPFIIRGQVK